MEATHRQLVLRQCEIQMTDCVEEFQLAYDIARAVAGNVIAGGTLSRSQIRTLVWTFARIIEPRNGNHLNAYRKTGVRVGSDIKPDWRSVPMAMRQFSYSYWRRDFSPDKAYETFEEIHPFVDGNGRVGHLLWALKHAQLNGVWPCFLPPNLWNDPRLIDDPLVASCGWQPCGEGQT